VVLPQSHLYTGAAFVLYVEGEALETRGR
jgi:hypothetical protein